MSNFGRRILLIQGFLHIDEYPPDANQGFDIPSAVITFPNFHVSMQFDIQSSTSDSSLFSGFQVLEDLFYFYYASTLNLKVDAALSPALRLMCCSYF